MPPPIAARAVRFGRYEVNLQTGELSKNNLHLHLPDQPFHVLAMLLEHPGEVVSREDLKRCLWPDHTFVDFDVGLNKTINKLREALCDSAERPHYIETLPKRGYRFIAAAEEVEERASDQSHQRVRRSRTHWRAIMALSSGIGILAVLIFLLSAGQGDRIPSQARPPLSAPSARIESIAVLPLENLFRDPDQEYFADGLTDTLITHLATIPSLRVVSRQSTMRYKHSDRPLPEIARELKVDAILAGTVQRSGNRLRINIQIVQVAADQNVWGKTYESNKDDLLTIEEEVTHDIVREFSPHYPKPG